MKCIHFTKDTCSLVPRPPSEKSRKGLATRMAMRCPRGLYTRANQIAEIKNVTFNRGCANSSVQSISVAFEHCVLRDRVHVRQELSAGGASRKRHGLEYAKVWKPCRHFA